MGPQNIINIKNIIQDWANLSIILYFTKDSKIIFGWESQKKLYKRNKNINRIFYSIFSEERRTVKTVYELSEVKHNNN